MAGTLAIVALVVSALLLGTMILALVLLRKGEGPRYSASRAYESNRREALEALTGDAVEALPGGQWYSPEFREPGAGEAIAPAYREAVREALRVVVPGPGRVAFDEAGRGRVRDEGIEVVPAVSTAALRAADLDAHGEGRLAVGIVLFNPEPPGGEATRLALPVQALFPALERAGRSDLVRRFEAFRRQVSSSSRTSEEVVRHHEEA